MTRPVLLMVLVVGLLAAGVAGVQGAATTAAPVSEPVAAFQAWLDSHREGRPVCGHLTEDARAVDGLRPLNDTALDFFASAAPQLPENVDGVCEIVRNSVRRGLLRSGDLRVGTVTERVLSPSLSVLTADGERVLMERDVRTGAWLVAADSDRAMFNPVVRRLDAEKAGSESAARLQDALAELSTEATDERRRYGALLARRGVDTLPVAGCRGTSRTVTGRGPLRSATLRIAATSVCVTLAFRTALPAATSAATVVGSVIIVPRAGNPLFIRAARLAGGRTLLLLDATDGKRDVEPLSVLVKPQRWAFGTSGNVLRFRVEIAAAHARKLRRAVRWLGVLDRLTPDGKSLIGTQPRVDPEAELGRPEVLRTLAIHPGGR